MPHLFLPHIFEASFVFLAAGDRQYLKWRLLEQDELWVGSINVYDNLIPVIEETLFA